MVLIFVVGSVCMLAVVVTPVVGSDSDGCVKSVVVVVTVSGCCLLFAVVDVEMLIKLFCCEKVIVDESVNDLQSESKPIHH